MAWEGVSKLGELGKILLAVGEPGGWLGSGNQSVRDGLRLKEPHLGLHSLPSLF